MITPTLLMMAVACNGDDDRTSILVTLGAADLEALAEVAETVGVVVDPDTPYLDTSGEPIPEGDYGAVTFGDYV